MPQVRVLLEYTDSNPIEELCLIPPEPLEQGFLERPRRASLVAKTVLILTPGILFIAHVVASTGKPIASANTSLKPVGICLIKS
jgi:hypothetical protein